MLPALGTAIHKYQEYRQQKQAVLFSSDGVVFYAKQPFYF